VGGETLRLRSVQAPRSLDRTLREIFGARGAGNAFRVAA